MTAWDGFVLGLNFLLMLVGTINLYPQWQVAMSAVVVGMLCGKWLYAPKVTRT